LGATFVALYRGQTVSSARLIALSTDPALVADVAARVLAADEPAADDPVLSALSRGRRAALRVVVGESPAPSERP
jgi:hypothetical protein